jgi:uncharacterized protein DUF6412
VTVIGTGRPRLIGDDERSRREAQRLDSSRYIQDVARLTRYAWPTLAVAWVVTFVAAGAGSGVGGPVALPAMLLPAMLLASIALAGVSVIATAGGGLTATRASMARHTRAVVVLRSCDPDAAGRPRPRAPGA